MKKLFTLLFMSTLLLSCSQDNDTADAEQEALSFEEKLAKGDFDNSNLGVYKGLFSTEDGATRATIHITLNGISEPTVEFGFPNDKKAVVRSTQNSSKGQSIKGMSFNEGDFDFDFTVDADGNNPIISNITYMGQKGGTVLAKETSKSAVATKTGFYTCESGCFDDGIANGGDDQVPHPELGAPGARQTFSFMQENTENPEAADASLTIQFVLNRRVYTGNADLERCEDVAFSTLRRCELRAQDNLNGNSGPIRFRSLNNPETGLATHTYNVGAGSCSSYEGNAIYRSTIFGRSVLQFQTDDATGEGGDCL